ncbi:Adaptin [Entamoeba marina]
MFSTYSDFVRDLGNAHSKDEESRFVENSIKSCGTGAGETNVDRLKEYIKKMICINQLGYSVDQALFLVVNTTQHPNVVLQKTAIIAASALIQNDSEYALLLTNSLTKILRLPTTQPLLALRILSNFMTQTTLPAYTMHIDTLATSKYESVRAATIRSYYKMYLLSGPEQQPIIKSKLSLALSDSSPIVIEATIPIITKILQNTSPSKRIWPGLNDVILRILSYLVGCSGNSINKAPQQYKGYIAGDICAPFMQINMLRLLRVMNPTTKHYQQTMIEIMNSYRSFKGLLGSALQVEAVKTSMMCVPTEQILRISSAIGSSLFSQNVLLLVYCGLKVMDQISDRNPVMCKNDVTTVLSFIDIDDDVIATEATLLIGKITDAQEAVGIVLTLLDIAKKTLTQTGKSGVRRALLKVCYDICEKYTPDFNWYCNIVIKILKMDVNDNERCLQEHELESIYSNFIQILKDDPSVFESVLSLLYNSVTICEDEITTSLARFVCLVLAELCSSKGALLEAITTCLRIGFNDILNVIDESNESNKESKIEVNNNSPQNLLDLNIWDDVSQSHNQHHQPQQCHIEKIDVFNPMLLNNIEIRQRVKEANSLCDLGLNSNDLFKKQVDYLVIEKHVLISDPIQPKEQHKEPSLRVEEYKQEKVYGNGSSEPKHNHHEEIEAIEPQRPEHEEQVQIQSPVTKPTKKRWNIPSK